MPTLPFIFLLIVIRSGRSALLYLGGCFYSQEEETGTRIHSAATRHVLRVWQVRSLLFKNQDLGNSHESNEWTI